MNISCACRTLLRLNITKRSVSFAFNSADSDPVSAPCGTSPASPRVSHFPLTKTRFRCIRVLFLTSGYRTSSWFPLQIRARPGIYLLPGNEAKPPPRYELCWTRLLLNLADLLKGVRTHKESLVRRDRPPTRFGKGRNYGLGPDPVSSSSSFQLIFT